MHPHLETLSLSELVDRLEDLDGRRTPVGWSPDDAVEKTAIEGKIVALISAEPDDNHDELPCELAIQLRSKEQSAPASVDEIRAGGLFVSTLGRFAIGTHVDLQVLASDDHGLRARGIVRRALPNGVLVSVTEQPSEAHERRLRKFLLELVRHRLHS
jgi:hypothetical protein